VGREVVNPKRVNPATIRTYADLAKPALKGQLCLRNRQSPYNQSLVADQVIQRGEASTRAWIKGMTNNVTQPFFSSDTPLVRAVAMPKPTMNTHSRVMATTPPSNGWAASALKTSPQNNWFSRAEGPWP